MTPWSGISLAAVNSTGNLKQLYPTFCTPGTGAVTMGNTVRRPFEGTLVTMQVQTDGVDGGTIEIWDIDGNDCGADVNTSDVITNAQLVAAVAAKKARLIYTQNFVGTLGARLNIAYGTPFLKGLASRFIASAGTVTVNVVADGGFAKTEIPG